MKLNLHYRGDNIYERVRSRLNAFQVQGHRYHTRLPFQQVYPVPPTKMLALLNRNMVVLDLNVCIVSEDAQHEYMGYNIVQSTNGWLYVQRVGKSSEKYCHTVYRRFSNMTVEELLSYLWCETQDYITLDCFVVQYERSTILRNLSQQKTANWRFCFVTRSNY